MHPPNIRNTGDLLFVAGSTFLICILLLFFSVQNKPGSIICSSTGFLLSLLVLYYDGLKNYLLMQKIANTPTSKVEAAAVGLIELSGRAKSINTLSPLTNIKCAQWKVVIEIGTRGSLGSKLDVSWGYEMDIKSQPKFRLEDDTGSMLIDSTGADAGFFCIGEPDTDSSFPRSQYSGYISGTNILGMPHQKIDQKVIDFINTLDETTKNKIMKYQYRNTRFSEYYIAENDNLFVFGNAEPMEGVSSAVKAEDMIVKKGGSANILLISETGEREIVNILKLSSLFFSLEGLAFSALFILIIVVMYLHL